MRILELTQIKYGNSFADLCPPLSRMELFRCQIHVVARSSFSGSLQLFFAVETQTYNNHMCLVGKVQIKITSAAVDGTPKKITQSLTIQW